MRANKISLHQNLYPMDSSFFKNIQCQNYPIFQPPLIRNKSFSFTQSKGVKSTGYDSQNRSQIKTRKSMVARSSFCSVSKQTKQNQKGYSTHYGSQSYLTRKKAKYNIKASLNKIILKNWLPKQQLTPHWPISSPNPKQKQTQIDPFLLAQTKQIICTQKLLHDFNKSYRKDLEDSSKLKFKIKRKTFHKLMPQFDKGLEPWGISEPDNPQI